MNNTTPPTTAAERIPFARFEKQLTGVFDQLAREGESVLVEREGRVFRIMPQQSGAGRADRRRDPEQVRIVLQATAGGFREIDRDDLLARIREEREQESAGRPH